MNTLCINFTTEREFSNTLKIQHQFQKHAKTNVKFMVVTTKLEQKKAMEFWEGKDVIFELQPSGAANNNGQVFFDNYINLLRKYSPTYHHVFKLDSDTATTRDLELQPEKSYAHRLTDRKANSTIYGNFYALCREDISRIISVYDAGSWETPYVQLNYGENRCIARLMKLAERDFLPLTVHNVDWFSNWMFRERVKVREANALHLWSSKELIDAWSESESPNAHFKKLIRRENLKRMPKTLTNYLKFRLASFLGWQRA